MKKLFYSLFFSFSVFSLFSQTDSIQNGYIIAVGGGNDNAALEKISEILDDSTDRIIIVPTTCPDKYIDPIGNDYNCSKYYVDFFRDKGYIDVQVLHNRDIDSANSQSFIAPLKNARAVWFTGGRPSLLADSYLNTSFHKELFSILSKGGVIGGTSGGASILGSFLVRGQFENNTIMVGDHTEGFALLNNTAIDQHILARNRQFDMFEVLKKNRKITGIGIDENTTIVVHNNILEVVDGSYVAIYDGTYWDRYTLVLKKINKRSKQFYFLRPFDQYDLTEKKVLTRLNKKPIEISQNELKNYTGTYSSETDTVQITLIDDKLTIDKKELLPFSKKEFYHLKDDYRYLFILNPHGVVGELRILGNQKSIYKKMNYN
ncbi:MAG: Type 1 glutamine amidotransferase-like domain-containing protein [Saprospiraceae bacterium]|nr:Type 1 glutamine amidotransferase-like domain-containing protein [Saprospiraceae bacterium]